MPVSFATLLVSIFAIIAAALPARAAETRDLAGWWIAIDKTFPTLWERGDIVAMEELLIVAPDGRAENRGMGFWPLSDGECDPKQTCTDAPLIAAAKLSLKDGLLTFADREPGRQRINRDRADPAIRDRIALTATPAWTATLNGDLLILRAATANTTRAFARIAPDRLRRMRAGLMAAELSAARHWRCLFANATANEPAFAAMSSDRRAAPAFLNDYLRAASYRMTLAALGDTPTADDPDARRHVHARATRQPLLVETFPDLAAPKRHADVLALRGRAGAFDAKARGGGPASLSLAISDAEAAAFARVMRGTGSNRSKDADVARLFCLK
jgi:hypothetical protein